MTAHTIKATCATGEALFAVVDSGVADGSRGVLAASAAVAGLAPFKTEAHAIAAIERAGATIQGKA